MNTKTGRNSIYPRTRCITEFVFADHLALFGVTTTIKQSFTNTVGSFKII